MRVEDLRVSYTALEKPDFPVREVREGLGLSQRELAFVTQCAERSISGWENGAPISASARKQLLELQALQRELEDTLEPGSVGPWLRSSNEGFSGERPMDLIAHGESHRIWQLLFWIQSGAAS